MNKDYCYYFRREDSEKLNLLKIQTHAIREWLRFAFLLKLPQALEIIRQLFCFSYPPFKIRFKLFSTDIQHLSLFYY